jgi:hypothetical protein
MAKSESLIPVDSHVVLMMISALRHSGTTGVLENNTGHFYIDQNTDDSDIYLRSDNGCW